MTSSLLLRTKMVFFEIENSLAVIFGLRRFPDRFNFAEVDTQSMVLQAPKFSLKEMIGNGILWAVPKHRRSLEKRLKRKYGHPEYKMKLLLPKTNIRLCNTCGDHHEIGVLCPTCYKKVMDETRELQSAITEKLDLQPVEKEILILYENEKNNLDESFKGHQIVEVKKPRHSWFSKNLLQQTTQQPATTKDVKPSDLS